MCIRDRYSLSKIQGSGVVRYIDQVDNTISVSSNCDVYFVDKKNNKEYLYKKIIPEGNEVKMPDMKMIKDEQIVNDEAEEKYTRPKQIDLFEEFGVDESTGVKTMKVDNMVDIDSEEAEVTEQLDVSPDVTLDAQSNAGSYETPVLKAVEQTRYNRLPSVDELIKFCLFIPLVFIILFVLAVSSISFLICFSYYILVFSFIKSFIYFAASALAFGLFYLVFEFFVRFDD